MKDQAQESNEAQSAGLDRYEEEKRHWLDSLPVGDSEDVLFRFETMLKALDRFFNVDNHPERRSRKVAIDDNMRIEVGVADRKLRTLLRLCQSILEETDTSAFLFQSYVETQLISDVERDALLERHQRQNTPQESLYILQAGLRSLAHLTSGLMAADHVNLTSFRSLGHQYTSLIIQNQYFNPLRNRGFNPLYDRVEHPLLLRSVRGAPTEGLRRGLSMVILILNRYIKINNWIQPNAASREELHDSLPVLSLLRSDFRALIPYLETTFPQRLFPDGPSTPEEEEFLMRIDGFAFQLNMESRKVFQQFLLDFSVTNVVSKLRSGLEAAHGLMNTFLQQSVVNMVQSVIPDVQGMDVFPDFVSRFEQSKRLREDLWIFHEILKHVIEHLDTDTPDPLNKRVKFNMLLEFLTYFQNITVKLVRAADYEIFEGFFADARSLKGETFTNPNRNREISRSLSHFRIFLETTVGHVNQRTDLQDVPLDEEHARNILEQFTREDNG